MTRSLLLVCAIAITTASSVHAQFTVPDSAFAARLNFLVPSAMTGADLDTLDPSVAALTYMNVSGAWIYDLDGIQYFTGLQALVCSYNYLTTLPALPDAIINLDCRSNDLVSMTSLPNSLTQLFCFDNQLTSLPALPPTLDWLVCYDNALTSLPALPNSITQIACSDNGLTGLPALPLSLEVLLCANNPLLTTMPALPGNLYNLSCDNNGLTAMPALPASLTQLSCNNNALTALPTLPASLIQLHCDANDLTTLPALPPQLKFLYCSQNQLTTLPALPASLRYLVCYNNVLAGLPTLPSALNRLECENNPIGVLPTLPDSLTWLYASNNNLTSLPALPDTLSTLYCFNNQLTSLPQLGSRLTLLNCDQNLLTALPDLPSSLQNLLCSTNPIYCIPVLPNSVIAIQCMNTNVTCLPNIPTSYSAVSSQLPFVLTVCNVLSPCPFGGEAITGTVFNDANGNGVKDVGEAAFTNAVIEAQPGSYLTAPDAAGNYVLPIDTGSYAMDGQAVLYHTITTPPVNITLAALQIDSLNDIGYQAIPGIHDLVVDIATMPARPGFDNNVYITVENIGTESTVALLDLTFDINQTWVGSGIAPDTQIGNGAAWTPTIAAGSTWGIAVTLHTDAAVVIGTPLTHLFVATPSVQDTTPADNSMVWAGFVVGAYDPNDKQVEPGSMTPAQVQAGEALEYTIRFQNTGTFPAERVIITDTLSTDLLWNTMELVSSSHTTEWYIHQGVLHFVMDPINLPDSTSDEPNSHGYVKFRMTPVSTLQDGAQILNVANIYFDFNEPVITAPAVFTVDQSVGISASTVNGFSLYPNPANEQLTVQLATAGALLQLRSSDGRLLQAQRVTGMQVTLGIGHLAAGVYVVTVEETPGSVIARRFVKQ
ncbi:MAG: T9SS type A sorting domain-containing protein [Flavobacteriales bacterium]